MNGFCSIIPSLFLRAKRRQRYIVAQRNRRYCKHGKHGNIHSTAQRGEERIVYIRTQLSNSKETWGLRAETGHRRPWRRTRWQSSHYKSFKMSCNLRQVIKWTGSQTGSTSERSARSSNFVSLLCYNDHRTRPLQL